MGIRLLLDTNSIIALLNENGKVVEVVDTADEIFISVINELEFTLNYQLRTTNCNCM